MLERYNNCLVRGQRGYQIGCIWTIATRDSETVLRTVRGGQEQEQATLRGNPVHQS